MKTLHLIFVSLTAVENRILEKGGRKRYIFYAFAYYNIELVLILSTKIIKFHIGISAIEIRVQRIEGSKRSLL